MALYLGSSEKLKVNVAGYAYKLVISSHLPDIAGVMLLSLDNYILKDSNGVYLIPKIMAPLNAAMSADGYILKDLNELYITIKEND